MPLPADNKPHFGEQFLVCSWNLEKTQVTMGFEIIITNSVQSAPLSVVWVYAAVIHHQMEVIY